jgi:hypothetical protein
MTPLALVLWPVLLFGSVLTLGYLLSRAHDRLDAAEKALHKTRRDLREATADAEALADVVASHVEMVAANEGTIAHLRDQLADVELMLTTERARTEIHESSHVCLPTLPGIREHGVTEPAGEVVDDEPVWLGLVREVADVVPMKRGKAK